MAVQNLVPANQISTAMAIVIFTQNLGGGAFLVAANAIFNNGLRKQLEQRASIIKLDPNVIIERGALSVRKLGLSTSQLAAVLESYATSVDHVMYLGVGVAASTLAFSWGLGMKNILEVKKLKELTDDRKEEGSRKEKSVGKQMTV